MTFNILDNGVGSVLEATSSIKTVPQNDSTRTSVNFDKYSQNTLNGKYIQFGIQIDGGSKGTSPSLHFTADLIDTAIRADQQSLKTHTPHDKKPNTTRLEKQRCRVEDLTIKLNTRQLHGLASQLCKYAYKGSNK